MREAHSRDTSIIGPDNTHQNLVFYTCYLKYFSRLPIKVKNKYDKSEFVWG